MMRGHNPDDVPLRYAVAFFDHLPDMIKRERFGGG